MECDTDPWAEASTGCTAHKPGELEMDLALAL